MRRLKPRIGRGTARGAGKVFSWLFPEDCRICGAALENVSRVPVCPTCLKKPTPLVAEYFCLICRTPFQSPFPLDEQGRCGLCRAGAHSFDAAYAYGAYEGALQRLIHLYKYGRVHPLAEPLGRLLAGAIPRTERFDMVTPMPMHWWRRWRRGFNQAELLAVEVARRSGLPVVEALRREWQKRPQAGLSHRARRMNVRSAFQARSGVELEGKRVLLVDDVFTTGATASAAAKALKSGGARYVAVLTLARVDRRQRGYSDQAVDAAEFLSSGVY